MRKLIYPIVITSVLALLITDIFISSGKSHTTKTENPIDSIPHNKTMHEWAKKSNNVNTTTYQGTALISN